MDAIKGAAIAAGVAALLASMACSGTEEEAKTSATQRTDALVKCEGINTCKGTSECQGSDGKSACQGLNECKGQGWITVPSEECTQKGGKVLGANAPTAAASSAPAGPGATPPAPQASAQAIKCEGINTCKGTSDCASKDSACKGQNSCKGHGWVTVPTEAECLDKGGKVIA